jgi:Fe-S oxidoreductase
MATYKAEALHQRYRGKRRPASHYVLGRLPQHARLGSVTPRITNAVFANRLTASALKMLSGIDSRRELPRFAQQTFKRWFKSRPRGAGSPLCLWVDTFTEHFAPEVGKAAIDVLEAAGYSVSILGEPACCGLTWISTGQLDHARAQLRRTLDALEPALSSGIPIVGLEPSCVAVFRHDSEKLLPHDPRAKQAASAVKTLAELLSETNSWVPPSIAGVDILVQPHCHQHAVLGFETDQALLEGAGANVKTLSGCCGMAGNFGVERGHYEVSVAVAESELLPALRSIKAETVLLADGFSCRTQISQLGGVKALHLAELLAAGLK